MKKTCFKCHVEKDIEDFYPHNQMVDGHLGKCKSCTRIDVKAHRESNIERIRAYDRSRGTRTIPLPNRAAQREWISRNPEKRAAHMAVEQAVGKGTIHKAIACEICGGIAKLSAHHTDYNEPLIVVWLCYGCHRDVHGKSNRAYLQYMLGQECAENNNEAVIA